MPPAENIPCSLMTKAPSSAAAVSSVLSAVSLVAACSVWAAACVVAESAPALIPQPEMIIVPAATSAASCIHFFLLINLLLFVFQ